MDDQQTETPEAKRTRLLAAQEARRIAADTKRRDDELVRLELVERFEKECNGAEDVEFAVFDSTANGLGFFVVKLADAAVYKRYLESKQTIEDRFDFVSPSVVYPDREAYLAARARRPGLDQMLANKLAALYGLVEEQHRGK